MKKCSKCNIEKDESEFYKNKHGKNGLLSHCKECCNKLAHYKRYHKPKPKEGYKVCPLCKEEKLLEFFYKHTTYCIPCNRIYRRAYYHRGDPNYVSKKVGAGERRKYEYTPTEPLINGSKKCTLCKKEKPYEEFHPNRKTKNGRSHVCKQCMYDIYHKNFDITPTGVMKKCPKCNQLLDTSNFHHIKNSKDGRAAYCRKCFKVRWCTIHSDREYNSKNKKNKLIEVEEYYKNNIIVDEDEQDDIY